MLQPKEKVKFVGKLHWIIYGRAIFWLLLAIAAVNSISRYYNSYNYSIAGGNPTEALLILPLTLLLIAIVSFVRSLIVRVDTEIVVTDKRIIHKVGFIARASEEMNISQVETVDVRQGILGRILGYGAVLIRGSGFGLGAAEDSRVATSIAERNHCRVTAVECTDQGPGNDDAPVAF